MDTSLKSFIFAAAATAAFAIPSDGFAWECLHNSCPVWCDLPITYAVGDLPEELDETAALQEIQRAFDAWNAPDCVDLGFTYLGRTSEITETPTITISALDPWPAEFGSTDNTFAIATTSWDMSGCLVSPAERALINLNDETTNWSTSGEAQQADLYSILLQQLGLSLGIGMADFGAGETVVLPAYGGPITTGILEDDENAICYLYADGTVEPGTTIAGEPPENCVACDSDAACGEEQICVSTGPASYCYLTCDDTSQLCPEGSTCFIPPEETEGVCIVQAPGEEPSCPASLDRPEAPDAGPSNPDMGTTGGADMGTSAVPDLGTTDEGPDDVLLDDTETSGSGCCAVADGSPDGSFVLLLLAALGVFLRRR